MRRITIDIGGADRFPSGDGPIEERRGRLPGKRMPGRRTPERMDREEIMRGEGVGGSAPNLPYTLRGERISNTSDGV